MNVVAAAAVAAVPCLLGVNGDNCTSSSFISALIFKWILKFVTKQILALICLVALASDQFLFMSVITLKVTKLRTYVHDLHSNILPRSLLSEYNILSSSFQHKPAVSIDILFYLGVQVSRILQFFALRGLRHSL